MFRRPKFEALSYDASMRLLRALTRAGSTHRRVMRQLARQAVKVAPTDQERRHAERWLAPLEAGRRIRISTFPVKVWLDGNTPELEADVESAFTNVEDPYPKEQS